ncbi:hypothetical protein [Dyella caseinilytica]|uniref:Uncharacterized protein n=1 Tax=Dyella caseinilytica TaxID=1849581 RepID=A0ABX7H1C5_9GAMM|nr:hypothetical protein [Dyella caseinilytica]QRN55220.1 hypothetical protein ISN74_07790 [Dyella caseinilytica]GGA00187.1 hypothetical protein GCM10011408_21330 [Dyella caseinilytica]
MNALATIPATIRGRAALDEVRALFDQLYLIDSDIELLEEIEIETDGRRTHLKVVDLSVSISHDEMRDVLQRRRDAVLTKLENKGIRIAPDPAPDRATDVIQAA